MTRDELARYLDHTLLLPDATAKDIEQLVHEALIWNTYAVCVNSAYVAQALKTRSGPHTLKIAATVGFPLGQSLTQAKVAETIAAIEAGADEIDVVWNLGLFLSNDRSGVYDDLHRVIQAAQHIPVKVILETGRLTPDQIRIGAQIAVDAGAHTVKTSTGFQFGGATIEAVSLLRQTVGPTIGVKASGGIRTYEDAIHMIAAGATRIGLSKTEAVLARAPLS